ncbi:hypothetical protein M885DRAFT_119220 [Pelagophyceae sp. CCMP2097]|nr:hypothetical protein M885DRAFT_119220 [Pelagophyceae sp. CCMP2097]
MIGIEDASHSTRAASPKTRLLARFFFSDKRLFGLWARRAAEDRRWPASEGRPHRRQCLSRTRCRGPCCPGEVTKSQRLKRQHLTKSRRVPAAHKGFPGEAQRLPEKAGVPRGGKVRPGGVSIAPGEPRKGSRTAFSKTKGPLCWARAVSETNAVECDPVINKGPYFDSRWKKVCRLWKRGPREEPLKRGPREEPLKRGPREKPLKRGPREEPLKRGHREEPLKRGRREEPLKRGPREEPLKRGPREEPLKRGPREEPLKRGRREEPLKRGPREEPLKRGPREEPLKRGRREEPLKRGPREEPLKRGPREEPPLNRGVD